MAFDTMKWLALHGLGVYAPAFRDNHIEAETLSSLTMDDLREIGVTSVGHRRKILAAIASLTGAELQPANLRAELLDGERIHALLTVFFEHVDRIIADFGGRIDKHIGDCAMAVFGAPIAHGDDARRAVASALAIHAATQQVSEAVGRAI